MLCDYSIIGRWLLSLRVSRDSEAAVHARPWLIALLLILPLAFDPAISSLFRHPTFRVGDGPFAVVPGDVDGDGVLDLVVANSDDNDLSILKGIGDGTFELIDRHPTGDSPTGVDKADFNRDGRLDVVVANSNSDDVSILLGTGDGHFEPERRIAAGDGAGFIAVYDLDQDGIEDLVTANLHSDDLSILFGLGDGTFAGQSRIDAGDRPFSVTICDLNYDEIPDLVIPNSGLLSDVVSVFLGVGGGAFSSRTEVKVGHNPLFADATDLNGDGKVDIAVNNRSSNDLSVLLGRGDGTFETERRVPVGGFPFALGTGDFDDDAIKDIVAVGISSTRVTVLRGVGDGTFTEAGEGQVGNRPVWITLGDFNGDGREDVATANFGSDDISVLLGVGNGAFALNPHLEAGRHPTALASADLNDDQVPDLVVTNNGLVNRIQSDVSILIGLGDGEFSPQSTIRNAAFPRGLTIAELNGDRLLDLAIVGNGLKEFENGCCIDSPGVSVHLGRGEGAFEAEVRFDTGGTIGRLRAPSSIVVGDFDHDGIPDLAAAIEGTTEDTSGVSILLGLGGGFYAAPVRFAVGSGSQSVAIGDFNDDGIEDLVVANETIVTRGDISILLGRGDGTFLPQIRLPAGERPRSVAVGDLNGDGIQDLVVANAGSGAVSVFLGVGGGQFAPEVRHGVGTFPRSVVIADFNRDEILDISVANTNSNNVTILVGLGDGSFALEGDYQAGSAPTGLVSDDFDGDGWPDLAVANFGTNDVTLLFNQSPPRAIIEAEPIVECDRPGAGAVVLDGSASDENGDIVEYEWFRDLDLPSEELLGVDASLTAVLPLGDNRIALRITDIGGQTGVAEMTIMVVDTIPPTLQLSLEPSVLWPPNHRMVPVAVGWEVTDLCDSAPAVELMSALVIDSVNPDVEQPALSMGDIEGAEIGSPAPEIRLRAERAGKGNGRTYQLQYSARDASGNITLAVGVVRVPHDQGATKKR